MQIQLESMKAEIHQEVQEIASPETVFDFVNRIGNKETLTANTVAYKDFGLIITAVTGRASGTAQVKPLKETQAKETALLSARQQMAKALQKTLKDLSQEKIANYVNGFKPTAEKRLADDAYLVIFLVQN